MKSLRDLEYAIANDLYLIMLIACMSWNANDAISQAERKKVANVCVRVRAECSLGDAC
ncbi:hypothetical protein KCP70_03010 [Salmonella enterica subsp. enterica]|nr:hypothetical protein KCP70_03010 [Salmonella enterica subsp. enterica]